MITDDPKVVRINDALSCHPNLYYTCARLNRGSGGIDLPSECECGAFLIKDGHLDWRVAEITHVHYYDHKCMPILERCVAK